MSVAAIENMNLNFENLEYTTTKWKLDGIFLKKGMHLLINLLLKAISFKHFVYIEIFVQLHIMAN